MHLKLLIFFSPFFNGNKGRATFHTWIKAVIKNRLSKLLGKQLDSTWLLKWCVLYVWVTDNFTLGHNRESPPPQQTVVADWFRLVFLRNAFVLFYLIWIVSLHLIVFAWLSSKVSCPPAGTWTEAAATFACWPLMGGSTALAVGSVCC